MRRLRGLDCYGNDIPCREILSVDVVDGQNIKALQNERVTQDGSK